MRLLNLISDPKWRSLITKLTNASSSVDDSVSQCDRFSRLPEIGHWPTEAIQWTLSNELKPVCPHDKKCQLFRTEPAVSLSVKVCILVFSVSSVLL